jgi:hypothetical protein
MPTRDKNSLITSAMKCGSVAVAAELDEEEEDEEEEEV